MVINVRGQLDWATRLTGQTSFWVFLQGYFWMRLTFTPVDRVKQIALISVGLTQSVEGLESPKGLTLLQEKKNFSCLTASELGHWLILAFRLKHQLFLGLQSASLWMGITSLASLGLQLANSPCRSWGL